jgi:uncharacterized membrane protein YkvA (DUF1232 family)
LDCCQRSSCALVCEVCGRIRAAYALSPLDLIPDFIPVRYLDDLVIVPAGILLTVRFIPDGLMEEFSTENDLVEPP